MDLTSLNDLHFYLKFKPDLPMSQLDCRVVCCLTSQFSGAVAPVLAVAHWLAYAKKTHFGRGC